MPAPMYLEVDVTRDHIHRGVKSSPRSCPIALAVAEKYGDTPIVTAGAIAIDFDGQSYTYALPKKGNRFIHRFDSGKTVRPRHLTAGLWSGNITNGGLW